jgi:NitT/TauT family transport system ATP-binding protein
MSNRAVILSHNPARVRADLRLDMPYPRDKKTKEFKYLVDRLYTILTRPREDVPFAVRDRYQFLPHAMVGAVAGLMELVHERGDKADIFALSSELAMDVDDIFPLLEAAVFLGLGRVKEGDFFTTDKGRAFSEADTLIKKEIFRDTARNNIQLIKQIVQVLSSASKHRMSEEFFIEILKNHFTPEEAWSQLETAIDWGRYAELFAYDYNSGELYLETEE